MDSIATDEEKDCNGRIKNLRLKKKEIATEEEIVTVQGRD